MDENMAVGSSSRTWSYADTPRQIARMQATPKNAERSEIDDLLPISVRVSLDYDDERLIALRRLGSVFRHPRSRGGGVARPSGNGRMSWMLIRRW